jgi:teichoic acid transport system ATP-binding protein
MQAMKDLLGRAGTIVLVSHSLGTVAEFCDRAMWLDAGRVRMIGEAEETTKAYYRNVAASQ